LPVDLRLRLLDCVYVPGLILPTFTFGGYVVVYVVALFVVGLLRLRLRVVTARLRLRVDFTVTIYIVVTFVVALLLLRCLRC